MDKLIISPKTKVGELLDAYPQLEPVLMDMSPSFEKLRNPILRKTVARVATLQQIAIVGGLKIEDIIKRLREETGQDKDDFISEGTDYLSQEVPVWFVKENIRYTLDASPVINAGGSPMNDILRQANLLSYGEILELKTPFIPAPVIDMLRGKSYQVYCIQNGDKVISYISR